MEKYDPNNNTYGVTSLRLSDQLRAIADNLDSKEESSKHSSKDIRRQNEALLCQIDVLSKELDESRKENEALKEEALKAQEKIAECLKRFEEKCKAYQELYDTCCELQAKIDSLEHIKKAEAGKYRQHEETRAYEPKKGFRIKEE